MKEINDGGPAYPCNWMDFQPTTGEQVVREQFPGMSLRDWFAGQALVGILSNHTLLSEVDFNSPPSSTRQAASDYAFAVADCMIAARNKPTE